MRRLPPWIWIGLLALPVGCATRALPPCPPAVSALSPDAPEAPLPSVTSAFEMDEAPAAGEPAGHDHHRHDHHGTSHAR